MLQTIDFSKETKMIMNFSRESFFRHMAPDAKLHDSAAAAAAAAVRTRPRVILLAMKTMRKSAHGFPFLSCMSMALR